MGDASTLEDPGWDKSWIRFVVRHDGRDGLHSVNDAVNDNPADRCRAVPINMQPEQAER